MPNSLTVHADGVKLPRYEVESVVEDGKSSLVEEHTSVKGADEERRKLSKNVFVEATKKVQEIDCGTAPSLIEFNAMRNALADAKRAEAKAEHYLELERMRSSSRHQPNLGSRLGSIFVAYSYTPLYLRYVSTFWSDMDLSVLGT